LHHSGPEKDLGVLLAEMRRIRQEQSFCVSAIPGASDPGILLAESREPDFHITPAIKALLVTVSPAQIDRRLKADKDALRGKGLSGTRLGDQALMRQIPVRISYTNEERVTPGFCQIDTVRHCGWADSGLFCLTLADVASGWIFLFPLRNKAHRWVISWLKFMLDKSPFPVTEIHSDNGSEFINAD
jgi:hypothetical protein